MQTITIIGKDSTYESCNITLSKDQLRYTFICGI